MPLILPFIPVIQNTSLPAATVGVPYTATITSVSGVQPVTYAITSDSPNTGNWLSINPTTGVLSGTPTTAETESVTIVATDSMGQLSAPANFTLTVHPTVTFNFFMSPTGIDTNPGTLSQPWSLSAFNNPTLRTQYAGKSIGLIGDQGPFQYSNTGSGRISIYSQIQAGSAVGVGVIFGVNGGTSDTSRTFVGSCDSSGNYLPRAALIDCRDPVTLALPTGLTDVIGQSDDTGAPAPTNWGNTTIDGLTIAYPTQAGIIFTPNGSALISNITIQNCELYGGGPNNPQVTTQGNPAAIKFRPLNGGGNIKVLNNKIHGFYGTTTTGSQHYSYAGILFIQGASSFVQFGPITVKNNTLNDIGTPISLKDTNAAFGEISYNYCSLGDFGGLGSGASSQTYSFFMLMTQPGLTLNYHHNISLGCVSSVVAAGTTNNNSGNVVMTNNTFYSPAVALQALRLAENATTPGAFTFQNNIIYCPVGYSSGNSAIQVDQSRTGIIGFTPSSCDFNWYGNGITFMQGIQGSPLLNISQWRTAPYGFDVDSTVGGTGVSPFAGTPASMNYQSFSVTSIANVGIGGATCGAVDGSGSIGCNF